MRCTNKYEACVEFWSAVLFSREGSSWRRTKHKKGVNVDLLNNYHLVVLNIRTWQHWNVIVHALTLLDSVRHYTVPVSILFMPANNLQNLFPGVVQRLIQKPFAGGSFQVASLFWGCDRGCKSVIWCQLILVPENIPGHFHMCYLYQSNCVLGVSGSDAWSKSSCWDWGQRWILPSSNLPLYSSVERDKVYFPSIMWQIYFSEQDICNDVLHDFC